MDVCKTDLKACVRYLDDAALFYSQHGAGSTTSNRVRLIKKLTNKLKTRML